jgi:hypothetical protein
MESRTLGLLGKVAARNAVAWSSERPRALQQCNPSQNPEEGVGFSNSRLDRICAHPCMHHNTHTNAFHDGRKKIGQAPSSLLHHYLLPKCWQHGHSSPLAALLFWSLSHRLACLPWHPMDRRVILSHIYLGVRSKVSAFHYAIGKELPKYLAKWG